MRLLAARPLHSAEERLGLIHSMVPGEAEDDGIMPGQFCLKKGQGLCMWPDSQMGYDIVCHKAGEVTVGEVQRLGFLKPVTPEAKSGDKSTVDTG